MRYRWPCRRRVGRRARARSPHAARPRGSEGEAAGGLLVGAQGGGGAGRAPITRGRVTHESMCWVGRSQESILVEHRRIAGRHRDPLFLPVERNLACSLQESLLVQEARKPGRRSMGRVGTVQESNLIEPPRVAGGPGRVAWLGAALDLMLLEGAAPRRRSGSPAGHSGRR